MYSKGGLELEQTYRRDYCITGSATNARELASHSGRVTRVEDQVTTHSSHHTSHNTQHATHHTQHTTPNTQHTTHNTQHTTPNTQQTTHHTHIIIREPPLTWKLQRNNYLNTSLTSRQKHKSNHTSSTWTIKPYIPLHTSLTLFSTTSTLTTYLFFLLYLSL